MSADEAQPPGPAKRPNVLFVICDQLRADHLGFAGNPVVQTPNIDALAARGHELGTAEHSQFGHAHLIEITEHGSLAGAADPRALAGAATGF